MGWVEDLPSGRYRRVARNALTGKRWSKAHDRWADADAWWRREERDLDGCYTAAGLDVTRQQRGIPSFAEHVVEWARTGITDPELATLRGYQGQARMLAARWPTERVDEITEPMVRAYLAEMRDAGCSPSTRTLRLTVLRHAMRDAVAAGHRPDDPTLRIKGPKRVPLSARCLAALRDHVAKHNPAGKLGHVFPNPADRKRHLRPARVRDEWDRALKLAALEARNRRGTTCVMDAPPRSRIPAPTPG